MAFWFQNVDKNFEFELLLLHVKGLKEFVLHFFGFTGLKGSFPWIDSVLLMGYCLLDRWIGDHISK